MYTHIQSHKVYNIHRGIKAPAIRVGQALVLRGWCSSLFQTKASLECWDPASFPFLHLRPSGSVCTELTVAISSMCSALWRERWLLSCSSSLPSPAWGVGLREGDTVGRSRHLHLQTSPGPSRQCLSACHQHLYRLWVMLGGGLPSWWANTIETHQPA